MGRICPCLPKESLNTKNTSDAGAEMKLRYQGLLLTLIPLVCQLTFVGSLVMVASSLERAATAEAHAKGVLSQCEGLRVSLVGNYFTLATMRLSESKEVSSTLQLARQRIGAKIKTLRLLTAKDKESLPIMNEYLAAVDHISLLCEDARQAYHRGESEPTFSSFLEESEFFEEMTIYLRRLLELSEKIDAIYAPMVREFQPEATVERSRISMIIFVGVVLNSIISVFLAVTFGRKTAGRLEQLMAKLKAFAEGHVDEKPIRGSDEIAQLDATFRQMASQRAAADELRRSVFAMVSHDLRSPLTSVLGMIHLAVQNAYGELQPKLHRTLSRVESELSRLIRLSNDLLDIERLQTGKLDLAINEQQAAALITSAIEAVKGIADVREIEIRVECASDLEIECDGDRIIQVLVNYLSNAIKYSNRKSFITLRAVASPNEETVRFEVEDYGPGISAQELPFVFEKFKQLSQEQETKRQGSGLGLSICKSLLESHNGTVGVNSEPGKGSCFWFELRHARSLL